MMKSISAVGVGRETVDRNDAGKFVDIFDVGNMAQKVGYTFFERADIFDRKLGFCQARRAF